MSDRPIKLLVIDDDSIFRLGLVTALARPDFADLQVIAQTGVANALESLTEQVPDLVILEPEVRIASIDQLSGWQLCRQIKQTYPDLLILLFTSQTDTQELLGCKICGVEGYCAKGIQLPDLVDAIRQVAGGGTYWQEMTANLPPDRAISKKKWLLRLCESGLQQIDDSLVKVQHQLEIRKLSLFDSLFWKGRQRELLAARWIVNQLSPVEVIVLGEKSQPEEEKIDRKNELNLPMLSAIKLSPVQFNQLSTTSIVFENTLAKIQSGLNNLTGFPLEIDILQEDKKRELLYLVLNQLAKILEQLRFLEITSEQLPERRLSILRDLWRSSSLEFLSKYYEPTEEIEQESLVDILLQETAIIQEEILDKIPLVVQLFDYFLFEKSLLIDRVSYRPESPEVIAKAELLLENLITQIANSTIQVVLNNFSEVEIIKQNLYKEKFLSSREIARFRNQLSGKYRLEKYWEEPKAIFESKYRLLALNGNSINKFWFYSPRQEELNQLRGIPWTVTMVLEIRDAIAPALRTVVGFVGNGLVYILTQVIGRGIGLIGRGIIQGIGNTFQDVRYGRKREQGTGNRE